MAKQRLTDRSINRRPPATGVDEIWDDVIPGFGLRVNAGGRRSYFVRTRVNGSQIRRTVGAPATHTLAEARDAARAVLKNAAAGIDSKQVEAETRREDEVEARRAEAETFGGVARAYIAERAKHLGSRRELQRKLDKDILPVWGDMQIGDIRRADVKSLFLDKAATAPVAANRILTLTRAIFDYAIDEELIDSNPTARIRPEREVSRDRVLSTTEIKMLWDAIDAAPRMVDETRTALKLLLVTGQRRTEVVEAPWDEFDMKRREWRIPGPRTKNGLPHIVLLSNFAVELLDGVDRDGARVFSSIVPDTITQAMRRAMPSLELPGGRATPHDFRRTMITTMNEELGIEPHVVEAIVNHTSGVKSGVAGVYNRALYLPQRRLALDAWGALLSEIVEGRPMASNVVRIREAAE